MKKVTVIYQLSTDKNVEFFEFREAQTYAETQAGTVDFLHIVRFEEVAE